MGAVHEAITPELQAFLEAQPVFFVASAPLAADGHVNLSPKGLDTLRVLSPTQVAYLDLTGSGNETAAHLAENGRLTLMFCAFQGPPRILRLHARGRVVLPEHDEFAALRPRFPELPGVRQVVVADVERVSTSCGYGVPRMGAPAPRDQLQRWAERKGEDGLRRYRREKNARSIDGLAAPLSARDLDAPGT